MITMIEKIRNFAIETENFDSNSQLFRFIGTNNTFSDENEVKKSFAKTNDDDDDNDDPNRTLRFPKYCKQGFRNSKFKIRFSTLYVKLVFYI